MKNKHQIVDIEEAWYPFHLQKKDLPQNKWLPISRWLWNSKPVGYPFTSVVLWYSLQVVLTPLTFVIDIIFVSLFFQLFLVKLIDFIFESSGKTRDAILKPIEKGLSALFFLVGIALAIFLIYQTFKLDLW